MTDVIEVSGDRPMEDFVEETLIDLETQENYRAWKSNAVRLYDYLNTVNAIWPSLTVQFLPDEERIERNKKSKYRLLTGTFTSGQRDDYFQLGSVTVKSEVEEVDISKYDPDLEEFISSNPVSGKFNYDQKILHQGDINRARYMPQKPDLISTINNNGEVFIFDKTKHASQPADDFKFEIKLSSHKKEGFGLSWNNHREGHILSGSMDGTTKLWDITKYSKSSRVMDTPVHSFNTDNEGTNDVEWIPSHDSIFGSVGEDNTVKLLDTRSNSIVKQSDTQFQSGGVNALSFNFENQFCLATADSNGQLNIWDIRDFSKPIINIKDAHEGAISNISFNQNKTHVIATAGAEDSSVKLWDLSQDTDNQLIFKHGGHMLGVNDIAWNPHDDWMISSVANDNTLQIWKPASQLVN